MLGHFVPALHEYSEVMQSQVLKSTIPIPLQRLINLVVSQTHSGIIPALQSYTLGSGLKSELNITLILQHLGPSGAHILKVSKGQISFCVPLGQKGKEKPLGQFGAREEAGKLLNRKEKTIKIENMVLDLLNNIFILYK